MELNKFDLHYAVQRLPKPLKDLLKQEIWHGKVFIGGGYIRAIVAGEKLNDIDLFVSDAKVAEVVALALCEKGRTPYKTDNAYTIKVWGETVQIIHRWVFDTPEAISESFDFTVCCAVIYHGQHGWHSFCDPEFYPDLASKRLNYRNPVRNEDAGGSMLRVLKYYQRGYRIPLDSLSDVIARLIEGVNWEIVDSGGMELSKVICGLLREVDPLIDPEHLMH